MNPVNSTRPRPGKPQSAYQLKQGLGCALTLGFALSPALATAQSESARIKQLLEQMQEYQRQLAETNARLQALEKKDATKTETQGNGLGNNGYANGTANGNGKKVASDTATAKARNIQEQPDVEDPATAKVPKERFLKGFYDGGFTLRTSDNRYSITINGLAQARYTLNLPSKYTGSDSQTFDLALGRLFFSGTVFDPNLSYFFFYQTSTLANDNRVDTIDWWGKYQLGDWGIKAGRILPQYSRQFYTDIGKYLFMDLQAPEYAFSLQRTPGAEVMWHADKWTVSLTAGNSVRALDSTTQENTNLKLAGIARVVYDVLDPYTYAQETIPDVVERPQLSLGAAFGFNPVDTNSSLQNTIAGMDTYNGTLDIGYRYQLFNTEAAFFWREDHRPKNTGPGTSDNYGWYWQAGYFLLPKRLEIAGTANQVLFDFPDGSSYKNQTIGSVGLNYYFYDHNFKLQSDYSYITGEDWSHHSLEDNRFRLQGQVYF